MNYIIFGQTFDLFSLFFGLGSGIIIISLMFTFIIKKFFKPKNEELDRIKAKKDIENWAKKLREADTLIRNVYLGLNDVYKDLKEVET